MPRRTHHRITASATRWPSPFREVWTHRDLFLILALRDLKVRYKQTAIGVVWVILQPLGTALIFALVFGRWSNLPSDGTSYVLFAFAGMLPWTLFSQSLQRSGGSLVQEARLISKVYFPRILLPVAATAAVLVDFSVALGVALLLGVKAGNSIGWHLIGVPIFTVATLCLSLGVSFWVSALSVRYRDFLHALPFALQAWLYLSPVAYSASLVPGRWKWLYALNPMVGLIEGFRHSLFGVAGRPGAALILSAFLGSALLFVTGALVFSRVERTFADVV